MRLLLIIAVVLEANPFLAGASLTSRHSASSSHSPGILVALDINWGSISSIQCADGDAGAVARFFLLLELISACNFACIVLFASQLFTLSISRPVQRYSPLDDIAAIAVVSYKKSRNKRLGMQFNSRPANFNFTWRFLGPGSIGMAYIYTRVLSNSIQHCHRA